MIEYTIKIISDEPPKLSLGDKIAGGNVVSISCNEPSMVSAAWLSKRIGLCTKSINRKLMPIREGTEGKSMYNRDLALQMLKMPASRRSKQRKC